VSAAEAEILFAVENGVGRVVLNRPKALNALTRDMALALDARLAEWVRDPAVACVWIEGAGDRALGAGGDIRRLYDTGRAGDPYARGFFRDEYRMNRRIYRYPKPYVAIYSGIVMGGGVGVSVHGSHRIAIERTVFAMPETGIGLFPDVGGGYFLPRLPGEIGLFLALTGTRLKAADCLYARVADAFVPEAKLGELRQALGTARNRQDAGAIVARFAQDPGRSTLEPHRATIDRCFSTASVQAVLAAFEAEGSDFARAQAATIRTKSPTSLELAFRQIRAGRALDFEEVMRMEYRIACGCLAGHDFYEGVRAVVIDKDQAPRWRPASLSDIAAADIDRHFAPPPDGDLTFD